MWNLLPRDTYSSTSDNEVAAEPDDDGYANAGKATGEDSDKSKDFDALDKKDESAVIDEINSSYHQLIEEETFPWII